MASSNADSTDLSDSPDPFADGRRLRSLRRRISLWFAKFGRTMPWRETADPYRILVSEIMLQQTTVATVTPRYETFLAQFPSIAALAAAPESAVLKAWEGLGYYRRARSLWQAARTVTAELGGELPTDPADLRRLPGVGRYTANAVLCFAMDRRLPILEANTKRLWSRVLGLEENPDRPAAAARLWEAAEIVLPKVRAREFNWALMDLGASVCRPQTPNCPACPLQPICIAAASGTPARYPTPARKTRKIRRREVALVVECRGRYLLEHRTANGRYGQFWQLPTFDLGADQDDVRSAAVAWWDAAFEFPIEMRGTVFQLKYVIVNESVELFGLVGVAANVHRTGNGRWHSPAELAQLPMSSPQRRLLAKVLAERST